MNLDEDRTKYFSYLREKFLPALPANGGSAVKSAAENLEWNARKILGEAPGESIDVTTYVSRTKFDMQTLADTLPAGSERDWACEVLQKIDGFFGLKTDTPPAASPAAAAGSAAAAPVSAPAAPASAAPAPIDIRALLADKAKSHPEKLEWDKSIVDLCKLVGLDSSAGARKKFAIKLGMPEAEVEAKSSADANMWLHKTLLDRMAANGGKIPAELS